MRRQRKALALTQPIRSNLTVNKLLIAGEYDLLDSANTTHVVFSMNGAVSGIAGYTDYLAGTDFIGPETPDYITFGSGADKYVTYAFIIAADTLKLYETTELEGGETQAGKLRYVLKRR